MKGDFSRDTFDFANHFSRVLMQQGRVQLDADWNEQTSILLHYLQTLAADLIGPHGGPADALGFGIEITNDGEDLKISKGRYYVDGILCENERDDCFYSQQPDYPVPTDSGLNNVTRGDGNYLVYLDVWERHISYLDDDHIREVALGGPDTATRAKVVWQVKIKSLPPDDSSCEVSALRLPISSALMAAQVKPVSPSTDPCITAPDSKYRGAENQLYRVEIHEVTMDNSGKTNSWSFKWSRDNGSIAAAIVRSSGPELTIHPARGFASGQWVELISDEQELRGEPGKLVKVVKVEGDTLTVDLEEVGAPTKVRRWDQREAGNVKLRDGAIPGVSGDTPIDLEHGIQVQFASGHNYLSGDYWLIPARVATGSIEWPLDEGGKPAMLPARGIRHHYAPLASLNRSDSALKINGCHRCINTQPVDCET